MGDAPTLSHAELNILLLEGARTGNVKLIKEALDAGADVTHKERDDTQYSALHLAALGGHNLALKVLLDRGCPVGILSGESTRRTALHLAIKENKSTIANTLIRRGADVNALTAANETTLHKAAFSGNQELIALILGAGVDPCLADKDGNTPLHLLARSGDPENGEFFLEKLSKHPKAAETLNMINTFGLSALHEAVIYGHLEFVQLLLAQPGIQANLQATITGATPLHEAVSRDTAKVAQLIDALLKAGADKTIKNSEGKTPAEVALPSNLAALG